MGTNKFYMLERSRSDVLIKAYLDEKVDTFTVGHEPKGKRGRAGRITGTLTRDDTTGAFQGGGVDVEYRNPSGARTTFGWSRTAGTAPPPAPPSPVPSPAPSPVPSPAPGSPPPSPPSGSRKKKPAKKALPAAKKRSPAKKKGKASPRSKRTSAPPPAASPAAATPPPAAPASTGPTIKVTTATSHATAMTGIGRASKMRAAAQKRIHDLASARQRVRMELDRAKAKKNIFAGATSSALPTTNQSAIKKTPTESRWKKAGIMAGAAAIIAAARHL